MLDHAPLVWGEIAVVDMERAIAFYQQHFGVSFKREVVADIEMAIIETVDKQAASIALVKCQMMKPSMDGSVVYLHVTDKLSELVAKLVQAGVTILFEPIAIHDGEFGYCSLFVDCEGNKVGLWSPQL
ncbi:VOC family protein [Shewanella marina]|uniref:VOC family protein n=1 Tax=Shewanella marina TaxID=487319 RepID=UPI00046E821C|nr:VOC family protein [Shewanella marina]